MLKIPARSPVFNAMFEHCLSESSSNVIKIDDMDKTTLKSLLKFIYCEKVDKMDHLTPSLMMAAEKYDMKELKIRCACHLRATLSPQNAVSCLVAADFIDEKILKKDSIHFIGKFFNETIETPEWDEMVTNKPSLLFQMFYLWRSKKK
jgi:speckle-type POZ protein